MASVEEWADPLDEAAAFSSDFLPCILMLLSRLPTYTPSSHRNLRYLLHKDLMCTLFLGSSNGHHHKRRTTSTNRKTMASMTASRPSSFFTSTVTGVVMIVRLSLVLLKVLHPPTTTSWLYRPSILSVLVRPHQTLSHLREAQAIQALAVPNGTLIHQLQQQATANFFLGGAYVANDTLRIPPLLLAALSALLNTSHPELWLSLILFLVDLAIAHLLEQICNNVLIFARNSSRIKEEEDRQRKLPKVIQPDPAHIFAIYIEDKNSQHTTTANATPPPLPMISMSNIPRLAALLYFGSPWTILPSSLYGCWQNIPTLFLLASIYEATCGTGYYIFSSCLLAMGTYLELFSVVYSIPAILLFCFTDQRKSTKEASIQFVAMIFMASFVTWTLCLHGWAASLVGPREYWKALYAVYGGTWLTTSPNLSLQWYFRMQLFARFRDYFGAIFLGIPYVLIGPLTIRLWKYPEVLVRQLYLLATWPQLQLTIITFHPLPSICRLQRLLFSGAFTALSKSCMMLMLHYACSF